MLTDSLATEEVLFLSGLFATVVSLDGRSDSFSRTFGEASGDGFSAASEEAVICFETKSFVGEGVWTFEPGVESGKDNSSSPLWNAVLGVSFSGVCFRVSGDSFGISDGASLRTEAWGVFSKRMDSLIVALSGFVLLSSFCETGTDCERVST